MQFSDWWWVFPGWFNAIRRRRFEISAIVDLLLLARRHRRRTLRSSRIRPRCHRSRRRPRHVRCRRGIPISCRNGHGPLSRTENHRVVREEVILVMATSAVAGIVSLIVVLLVGPPRLLPISVVLSATAYQMLGALGLRYGARSLVEIRSLSLHERPHRLLVFGAGDAGRQMVHRAPA